MGGLVSSEGGYKREGRETLREATTSTYRRRRTYLIFSGFFKHEFLRLLLRFSREVFVHIYIGWVGLG